MKFTLEHHVYITISNETVIYSVKCITKLKCKGGSLIYMYNRNHYVFISTM